MRCQEVQSRSSFRSRWQSVEWPRSAIVLRRRDLPDVPIPVSAGAQPRTLRRAALPLRYSPAASAHAHHRGGQRASRRYASPMLPVASGSQACLLASLNSCGSRSRRIACCLWLHMLVPLTALPCRSAIRVARLPELHSSPFCVVEPFPAALPVPRSTALHRRSPGARRYRPCPCVRSFRDRSGSSAGGIGCPDGMGFRHGVVRRFGAGPWCGCPLPPSAQSVHWPNAKQYSAA